MEKYINVARKYPLSCLCVVIIWILCFCTPPHTPLDNIAFIDKWTHITMYAGTCIIIWYEYIKSHEKPNKMKLFEWAWLAPILMSGAIEILQEYCTGGRRSGDWLDFAANATGATLAAIIGILVVMYRARR
ncbi:MAG: VanZ family protein [Prevotella sp.]|nr:VanZ family protein [Prevotella sp.]